MSSYYDMETELYYQNAVFYNSTTGAIVMENSNNIEIAPLSYGDELDYAIFCMQQEYFRAKIARGNFTQSGGTMYYNDASICEVYGAGYGTIKSCSELDYFWNNYSDRNVHFSYVGGN